MDHVAIVIPIYKPYLSSYENISLIQLLRVLPNHPIIFVYPDGMDISYYKRVVQLNGLSCNAVSFHPNYFISTETYNHLLLSLEFFLSFDSYEYVLIYQLDALVFKDNLMYWVKLNYDYIGAPWFNIQWQNLRYINSKLPMWAKYSLLMRLFMNKDGFVGNGGFSLRKISSHIKILGKYKNAIPDLKLNEDVFWAKFISSKEKNFKIPLRDEAVYFAFETNPQKCIEHTKGELPFGCHAWYREENINFWKPYLTMLGYDISG